MNKIFKKILIEIDKLPSVDKKNLLDLNTYQLEIMSKIVKKSKVTSSEILNSQTNYSKAQKYRYIKELINKNLCFRKNRFYTDK